MNVIATGAEAVLRREQYLGRGVLVKERVVKSYREKSLDEKIRRERTQLEANLLHKAKLAGVRTPSVYKVDFAGCRIFLEMLKGKRVKEFLGGKNLKVCREIGKEIGKLHLAGIVHGDLTTSNLVLLPGGKIAFLDFGLGFLSEKIEDRATDLLVFKKTFLATHPKLEKGWQLILDGYGEICKDARRIGAKIVEVEGRARYA